MSRRSALCLCTLLLACGDVPEATPIETQELRAGPRNNDHGPLTLGYSMDAELSRNAPIHTWTFTLPAPAEVTLRTEASVVSPPGTREVDTVLVLQRIEPTGRLRWLAQNDDVGRSRYSQLVRPLPAGEYRALVHGFRPSTRGRFAFTTGCVGEGCPAPEPRCWFGDSFSDLRTHAALTVASETWIRDITDVANDTERAQLLLAVQQASYEVNTAEEALAAVDQQEVRRMELHDASGAVYLALEYGAGDNSYGAIFAAGSTDVLASIHDGDLIDCTVRE